MVIWDYFGVILGVILESLWGHFGVTLGSFWDHFGIILGLFWDHFGIILGSLWDHFWDHPKYIFNIFPSFFCFCLVASAYFLALAMAISHFL